jgi:uncharacterized protein YegL
MTTANQDVEVANQRGDDRHVVLPFYLLTDVSGSMAPHIGALNKALVTFRDTLARNPILADKVQFGVIDFSDSAGTVIPLGDFSTAHLTQHTLTTRGGTNYGAAFRALRDTIEADLAAGADRYRYFRPAVFFLTDGCPTDSAWPEAFAALTGFDKATGNGFRAYPLFVPFGIGSADATILARLVHPQDRSSLFMAAAGTTPEVAIEAMTKAMLTSILSSGQSVGRSVGGGTTQHVMPTQSDVGPGVTVYPGGDFVT